MLLSLVTIWEATPKNALCLWLDVPEPTSLCLRPALVIRFSPLETPSWVQQETAIPKQLSRLGTRETRKSGWQYAMVLQFYVKWNTLTHQSLCLRQSVRTTNRVDRLAESPDGCLSENHDVTAHILRLVQHATWHPDENFSRGSVKCPQAKPRSNESKAACPKSCASNKGENNQPATGARSSAKGCGAVAGCAKREGANPLSPRGCKGSSCNCSMVRYHMLPLQI